MILSLLAAALLSTLFCGLYLLLARRRRWLDQPSQRSSHAAPVPHGGGTGIMLALVVAGALAQLQGVDWDSIVWLLLALALVLSATGVLDDLMDLPVWLRFAVYGSCCLVLVMVLPLPPLLSSLWLPAWLWWPLAAIGLLWLLNLYNFMDGIDGIAALQAVLACSAAAGLAALSGAVDYALLCLLLALCQLGFLVWNWPPAKLFMGDAGSVPTGFLVGGLALYGASLEAVPLACWLVLLAVFITDASWTLMERWRRGDNLIHAHRQHGYQRLSRHWRSHLRVDLLFLMLHALWLLPLAWTIWMWPKFQILFVILAYVPLLLGMARLRRLP
ncbi:MraY family glycosyltransferase [Kineobactrum salinum]|uniref:Glycosyltransferase family 4 protein n=1 Tax=Kineobactrum salinum TaxID=2708301 RepID=A0A6C0U5E0_9GAMM|nr:glycosyltransferase family 4 protein [Kineobactrum salinum]QIB64664.1 glycosyltransferase family 4 protein [Kineobactrum salinum]